jgi:hypothetical protein
VRFRLWTELKIFNRADLGFDFQVGKFVDRHVMHFEPSGAWWIELNYQATYQKTTILSLASWKLAD